MPKTTPEQNKALVLKAFDTLFNKRDYATAERFWSPDYIQHSAHIAPGREGLFNLIKSIPSTLKIIPIRLFTWRRSGKDDQGRPVGRRRPELQKRWCRLPSQPRRVPSCDGSL